MIKKGVILASGTGSRMAPFTITTSKAMAPIYTKRGAIPQIQFSLEALMNHGIEKILIIVSPSHGFQVMEYLGDGSDFGCNITYKIQDMSRPITGIAQALGLAREFTGEDKFLVVLGDNFFEPGMLREVKPSYFIDSEFTMFVKQIERPEAFGVLDPDTGLIVEKPEIPPSNLAVTGLYMYSKFVYDAVDLAKPSRRNELEITDVNNHMIKNFKSSVVDISKWHWQDMGTPESALKLSRILSA